MFTLEEVRREQSRVAQKSGRLCQMDEALYQPGRVITISEARAYLELRDGVARGYWAVDHFYGRHLEEQNKK